MIMSSRHCNAIALFKNSVRFLTIHNCDGDRMVSVLGGHTDYLGSSRLALVRNPPASPLPPSISLYLSIWIDLLCQTNAEYNSFILNAATSN